MKKTALIAIVLVAFSTSSFAQKLITRNGQFTIFSHTVAEDITAVNNTATGTIDTQTGVIAFSVPVPGFEFKKAAMQKHFNNKNFMHSKQYPNITFKGKVTDLSKVDFTKDGTYTVNVTGDLTIRDVTKRNTYPITISIKEGIVTTSSKFVVKDIFNYNVGRPSKKSKKNNVAENIEVTMKAVYHKM